MPGSAIVVNNQVMLRGAPEHASIGSSRLLYIANRPGAVAMRTDDDLRIEAENERMAKLGYIGYRPGSVAEPNAGHALFDADGVPERARVQRELKRTESAVITTVVSVRREDAADLGLATKQDWERMLRSQWPRYVESLGIMEPRNVRWVAAYHVNQPNNLHCHVFTWDSSGRFNELLPRREMGRANDALRASVLKPQRDELSLSRTRARDELVALMREAALDEDRRTRILEALPGEGSLKYARLAKAEPGAARAVDAEARRIVGSDARMRELRDAYARAVSGHAELKGLEGAPRESYVSAAEADLRTRLGNALIRNVKGAAAGAGRPRLEADIGARIGLNPPARRRSMQIAEEISGCLGADGARALSSGLLDGDPSRAVALRGLPGVGKGADAVLSSLSANARGVAALARRALSDKGRGDCGDEAGRKAVALSARALGALIAHAERLALARVPGRLAERRAPICLPIPRP